MLECQLWCWQVYGWYLAEIFMHVKHFYILMYCVCVYIFCRVHASMTRDHPTPCLHATRARCPVKISSTWFSTYSQQESKTRGAHCPSWPADTQIFRWEARTSPDMWVDLYNFNPIIAPLHSVFESSPINLFAHMWTTAIQVQNSNQP